MEKEPENGICLKQQKTCPKCSGTGRVRTSLDEYEMCFCQRKLYEKAGPRKRAKASLFSIIESLAWLLYTEEIKWLRHMVWTEKVDPKDLNRLLYKQLDNGWPSEKIREENTWIAREWVKSNLLE